MWLRAVVLCCLSCLCVCAVRGGAEGERAARVVHTASGAVRGYRDPRAPLYEFRSIPYATAPTGPHRFKAPLPAPVWLEPLEAVDKRIVCPQGTFPFMPNTNVQQENCLIANVYVPDTEEKNLPVVVYVHGGAFQLGHGDMMVQKSLVTEHNIILVTFNYRLGVHGFLCLGTEDVPGNAGMKDQVALLKWVNKNIAKFGGNPDDVTIAGYSAGSASVDLLMLSRAAQGLFNKVIPESGANTAAFSVQSDPLANAKMFAKQLNFTNVDDVYALEEFYKTASLDILTSDVFFDRSDSTFVFSPCVERSMKSLARKVGSEVFLDESPVEILKRGKYKKVPLLYGFANMEGIIRIDLFDIWKDKMNEKFSDFLPADLKFDSEGEREEVAKNVREFYFGEESITNESILQYVDYFTDVIFAYPTLRAVNLQVDRGHDEIYLYEYSFVDENTPPVPHTNVRGATHCAQSVAVSGKTSFVEDSTEPTEEFKKMASTIQEIWANFIKTGSPVPSGSSLPAWPPVSRSGGPHMSLARELQLRGSLLEHRTLFWDHIYSRYYRDPIPPPAPPPKHTEL